MGFEPTRAEPIGLAVQRLNHSATSSTEEVEYNFYTVDVKWPGQKKILVPGCNTKRSRYLVCPSWPTFPIDVNIMVNVRHASVPSRDRLVVRTLRCGRSNPGSNPGHGSGRKFYLALTVTQSEL